ncbi:Na+/H+ antiporter NhaA [Luteibacter yeojuensis]|uniref:Na+/H+ antiporter NhaA n=1 Tax=Luteibacter yeojuensis TaxID=345309 RepID=UPI001F04003B|nr:Na+/H+ antiporter NhaA [Luteibacter yeojuensis]
MLKTLIWRPFQRLLDFVSGSATGGFVLMGAAVVALVTANSPFRDAYESLLALHIGPLSVLHWVNDGLMAIFFLLVGLEIKREVVDGELADRRSRLLPGVAALGGMLVPALIYLLINGTSGETSTGWAIPSATDIAFALGVAALLGSRVPSSLKAFLAALAIIDDLGAVIIIAVFYTPHLDLPSLGGAIAVVGAMAGLNRFGVRTLWPYLALGVALWFLVHASGIHATLAGVATAFCIPLRDEQGRAPSDGDCTYSPLLRLEHALHRLVPLTVLPLFGLANAGIVLSGIGLDQWLAPVTLGVGLGLALGKVIGVFSTAFVAIRLGWTAMPRNATYRQLLGTALLCGIGFTMSLFIGMLAFPEQQALQDEAKLGILAGSVLSGFAGWIYLRVPARTVSA